ncbi:MAG: glutathione S-transferase family protein [Rhodospirillales bacterium]|nr:glutathione S-transferase family protein [Rhodospirillales bacterium]
MSKLTLVSHYLCPYVQRVAIVLTEKSVAFERVYVDLAVKPAWFVAQSPLGKTPLLQVDDQVLFESAAICEYLEDVYAEPRMHPADPVLRAQHRAWMEFGSAMLGDIWGYETAQDRSGVEKKAEDLRRKVLWLDQNLQGGPWFAGEQFSIVDAVFGPVFRYFDVFETLMDHQIFATAPKVRQWRARLAARPSVRDAVTADYSDRLHMFLKNKNAYLYSAGGSAGAAAAVS